MIYIRSSDLLFFLLFIMVIVAILFIVSKKIILSKIFKSYNYMQANNEHLSRIKVIGEFNIPKEQEKGEDADPILFVNEEKNKGLVGVFDGMGGAGKRTYTHKDTGKQHTAAYWACRIVRNTCEEMIKEYNAEESDLSDHIKACIRSKIETSLSNSIKNFPEAERPLFSKMMRTLPTTMAMCSVEVKEEIVKLNTFWAGDSRIYLLDKNKIYYLSLDDVESPDPFAPMNSDLPMSNSISQDRDFIINSYEKTMDTKYPFVVFAATDGCFGYFRNPIEFEYMLRKTLSESEDENEWKKRIENAIYDNGQQDDFSIAIIAINYTIFKKLKKIISEKLYNGETEIYKDYNKWRKEVMSKKTDYINNISALTYNIAQLKTKNTIDEIIEKIKTYQDEKDYVDKFIKSVNDNIYNSYIITKESEKYDTLKNNIEQLIIQRDELQPKLLDNSIDGDESFIQEALNKCIAEKETLELDTLSENDKWWLKYKNNDCEILDKLEINQI